MDFDPTRCRNETEVESKFLTGYLLPALGFEPDSWFQEVALGTIRLDLLVFTKRVMPWPASAWPHIRLVLEAKHPARGLDSYVPRLRTYLQSLDARHGLLTNGRELRVYAWSDGILQLVFQCTGSEVPAHLPALRRLIGRPDNSPPSDTSEVDMAFLPSHQHAPTTAPTPPVSPPPPAEKDVNMEIIAVYHNKGGVGKTTTVVNLAAALSKRGLRVLVVDLDAQANTTFATGLVQFEDEAQDDLKDRNVAHVLRSEELYPIEEVARVSRFCSPEIHVLPSHISLMEHEVRLNQIESSRLTLLSKLRQVADRYDVVLIDTPPSLNLYARIALIAADHLIIPSDLKPFANQGLVNVLEFIKQINEFRRFISKSDLNVLGVLPTKLSTNARFIQSTLARRRQVITERYGVPLMASQIFERDDVAKCQEHTQRLGDADVSAPLSILDLKPDSQAAAEFETLADEVVARVGLTPAGVPA